MPSPSYSVGSYSFDRDYIFCIAWFSTPLPLIAELALSTDIRAILSCHQLMGDGLNHHPQSDCAVPSLIRDTAGWRTVGPDMDTGFGHLKRIIWTARYHSRKQGPKNHCNQSAAFDTHGKLIKQASNLFEHRYIALCALSPTWSIPGERSQLSYLPSDLSTFPLQKGEIS